LPEEFLLSEKSVKDRKSGKMTVAIINAWEDWYLKGNSLYEGFGLARENTVIWDKGHFTGPGHC